MLIYFFYNSIEKWKDENLPFVDGVEAEENETDADKWFGLTIDFHYLKKTSEFIIELRQMKRNKAENFQKPRILKVRWWNLEWMNYEREVKGVSVSVRFCVMHKTCRGRVK